MRVASASASQHPLAVSVWSEGKGECYGCPISWAEAQTHSLVKFSVGGLCIVPIASFYAILVMMQSLPWPQSVGQSVSHIVQLCPICLHSKVSMERSKNCLIQVF